MIGGQQLIEGSKEEPMRTVPPHRLSLINDLVRLSMSHER